MSDHVTYIKNGSIAKIILNRPRNNPLDLNTLKKLIENFQISAQNHDTCVLFLAEGKNFTVGADLKYLNSLFDNPDSSLELIEFSESFQNLTRAMLNHPGVIIIGLHGWVVGGGFEISLSADLRIAAHDTQIKLPELSIGTMFSNGSTKLLSNIIGLGRAKELMFLGEAINAERAYEIGLVNHVCKSDELNETLEQLAKSFVNRTDAKALTIAKRLIHENIDLDLETTLTKELLALIELGFHEEFKKKVQAFVNK